MKRHALLCFLGLIVILLCSGGCADDRSDQQLIRIENQLQAVSASLSSMQQEMALLRRTVTDTQEQNRVFQQQVLETINSMKATYVNQQQAVNAVYVSSPGYPSSYYMRYRYSPPYYPYRSPYPYPPFPPFH
jgi:outer membrane lipoprotein-sorting protein